MIVDITLNTILHSIPNIDLYFWKINYIYGTSFFNFDILEFESTINNSQKGYLIKSNELIELSSKLLDLIDIDIIGDTKLSKLEDVNEKHHDFKISLIDSSYWEIYSSNIFFTKKWSNHKDIKIISYF